MIAGLRLPNRRTIAARPVPTPPLNAQRSAAFRAAMGPGFQAAASERFIQQINRR
ncbi:MAG: hypothetical protein AAF567_09870 [Actinomycetota bacterium]